MQERRVIKEQERLRGSPISDILLPLNDAKARLNINSRDWPIGTMREEELETLYEEELSALPFKKVMIDFLAAMVPKIFTDSSRGIEFELEGKLLLDFRVNRDPGLIIAGYLIDFTKIIDPQRASYEEIVRVIFEATDFLIQNKIPPLDRIDMNWHYMLGRSFGIALTKPDASLEEKEARRFASAYLQTLPKTQQGERAGEIFSRGIVGLQVGEPSPKIP